MSTDKMKAKIQKLLALAENAGTPEEAEAASRQAEKLMVKWGIEVATLTARDGNDEEIVEVTREYKGDYAIAWVSFAHNVCRRGLDNLSVLQNKSRVSSKRWSYLIGYESDVARAEQLLDSLEKQAWSAMRTWWRTSEEKTFLTPMEGYKARRQFLVSFSVAVARRLHEMRQQVVQESADSASTELVLVERRDVVDSWMNQKYSNPRPARGGMSGSSFGYGAGAQAGREASLEENHLASREQIG